ncbi:PAS domain-containing protein [Polynucleobacter sp. MWH-Jannik1A5]|jgi:PAS domain S-box-containing protein|uniref:PAS domain-containing protein n=1 Tax=Polynucleobacter sp. MWH-Jannik1A5 TaxID=1855890 RepID=UPI001C0B396C|nr:PAS domain-containing protein [Polynucleobacter sp. MWH-Jannik1A5]MBU3545711.1 PAS domain-containing protein [Polynucleobacter sp. MWH-Jannik1A5]
MKYQVDFEQLANAMGDGVVISDAKGDIVFWNTSAERIFGYSAAEALGKSLDIITPERFRARHWDGYKKSMETGTTRYGSTLLTVPALHKEGRSLSIAFTVAMLTDEDGNVGAIAAIVRDDTERFQTDRELKKRIAELEAKS